ncbi:MAG: cryptochrome/photolyase family protein [Solirubrobacteraceae bacterium]
MTAVVWFRRDLRVHDHPPLVAALREHERVVPLFVLDPRLIGGRFRSANRTQYLLDCLRALDGELRGRGGRLVVRVGRFEDVLPAVAEEAGADAVYAAGDVSPYARGRDRRVAERVDLRLGPGLFIARLGALETKAGTPFRVYSPFRRAWAEQPRRAMEPAPEAIRVPEAVRSEAIPGLEDLGFDGPACELEDRPEPGEAAALAATDAWARDGAADCADTRNVLAEPTSRMSQYLHFGCLSPLRLEAATRSAPKYRQELAWRDFYAYVKLHGGADRPNPRWSEDPEALAAWQAGRTGFPVVDAAMRQLVACGWMHNRARMIVASFLTKDLHIDWRLGEAFFMEHLIDGDLASNNGGWQWVAGTGSDPQDYTRVFNPALQQERFDPDGRYVRRWLPELGTPDYPAPIVDHGLERRRAIAAFREMKSP